MLFASLCHYHLAGAGTLKRFLTLDLVFILGILHSFNTMLEKAMRPKQVLLFVLRIKDPSTRRFFLRFELTRHALPVYSVSGVDIDRAQLFGKRFLVSCSI